MKKICITGASGFIGGSLCKSLINLKIPTTALVRNRNSFLNFLRIEQIQFDELNSKNNLKKHLRDCHCIVHCAGKAYDKKIRSDEYILENVDLTKKIAEYAVDRGVKRFVFLSSIKVNGESTNKYNKITTFKNHDEPNPEDDYGKSKFEAEKVLLDIASKTGLEVVIVRLPLVYGAGVRGNLNKLIKLINLKFPLPFKGIRNKRSLIGIDNVVDLIIQCIERPNASGKTFLVSDGKDLSTPELIKLIASAMGQSVKLFSFPLSLLKFFGFIFGKQDEIDRLTGSLQIDISHTNEILNWKPPVSVEEGIRRMVQEK
jgi:nucleoside-diphosphate-sugar epimerase